MPTAQSTHDTHDPLGVERQRLVEAEDELTRSGDAVNAFLLDQVVNRLKQSRIWTCPISHRVPIAGRPAAGAG